jgi:hypothetical protein
MTALNVGDIFEYHQFSDSYIAFVAKDERIVLFKPATTYSKYYLKYCAALTEASHAEVIKNPKFKKCHLDNMPDDFKACYAQEFSTLKKGSKVDFNYRGTIISGVVVQRHTLVMAKFSLNSTIIHITAEPYLFTQKTDLCVA